VYKTYLAVLDAARCEWDAGSGRRTTSPNVVDIIHKSYESFACGVNDDTGEQVGMTRWREVVADTC
jgi:hypothetical protein